MTNSSDYIAYNNQLKAKQSLSFYDVERFRYADACFESMLYVNNQIPLLSFHQKRLNATCEALDFEQTEISLSLIQTLIGKQEQKSHFYRIRYSLIRDEGSNYSPKGSKVNVLIECAPTNVLFQVIENLGLYTQDYKANTSLAKYKTANALVYVKARQFAQKNYYDDVLLKNEDEHWIEASSSNLFLVKDDQIHTSLKDSGAVEGVFSKYLCSQYDVKRKKILTKDLLSADEIFLTNSVKLIQPVKHFQDKKLEFNVSSQLITFVKQNLLHEE